VKEFTESRLALGAGELWDLGTRAEFEALAAEIALLDQLAEGTHRVSQAYRYAM